MFFPLYQLFIEESLRICRILKGSYYFTILIFPAVQIIVLTSPCLGSAFHIPVCSALYFFGFMFQITSKRLPPAQMVILCLSSLQL